MPELVGPDGDQTKQAEHHRALHTKLMRQVVGAERPVHLLRQPGRQEWTERGFRGWCSSPIRRASLVAEHLPNEGMVVTEVSRRALAAACPTGPDEEDDISAGPVNSAGEAVNCACGAGHARARRRVGRLTRCRAW